MAQIVTITNPLTGQPTQVDQLEHTAQEIDDAIARALPGGEIDITLQQITVGTDAAEYSATATYAMGDYCTHDGKLYRCTTAITEPEAWTEAHWTETTVGAELTAIYTALAEKADKSVAFTVTLTTAGWADNAQTISNANFLSAGYAYTVAPASGSFADYAGAMVYADDVTTNDQMVFHCGSAPTADLTVNIVRMVTAE